MSCPVVEFNSNEYPTEWETNNTYEMYANKTTLCYEIQDVSITQWYESKLHTSTTHEDLPEW